MSEYLKRQIEEKNKEAKRLIKLLAGSFVIFFVVSWVLFFVLVLWWFPHWKEPALNFLVRGELINNFTLIFLAEFIIFALLTIPVWKKSSEIGKLTKQLEKLEAEGSSE